MESSKYWCFQCNTQSPSVSILEDESIKCNQCNSTFVEEISDDSDKPQNFIPERPHQPQQPQFPQMMQHNNIQTYSLSDNHHVIRIPISSGMAGMNVINNISSLFAGSPLFQLNSFNIMDNSLLNFLNNHNNDAQFENLLNFIMLNDPNRYGNPPASERAINSLEKFVIENDIKEGETTCNVCLYDFEKGNNVIKMPCEHVFHEECVLTWLKMHNTCPVCRSELESNDPEYENRKNTHRETLRNYNNTINRNNNNNNNNGNDGGNTV
jgi:E3 ubiquitin-protein ligase RNF115/126